MIALSVVSKCWLFSRVLCSSKRVLTSVIIFLFLPDLPEADEASILSDLDLDLFASGLLDLSLVIGIASFGFFRGFGDSSSPKIVLDCLLHRSRQLSHRYLLLVFLLVHSRIDQGTNCRHPDDDGDCRYNSSVHWNDSPFLDCDVFACSSCEMCQDTPEFRRPLLKISLRIVQNLQRLFGPRGASFKGALSVVRKQS